MLPIILSREFQHLRKEIASGLKMLAWPDAMLYAVEEDVSLWCVAQQLHHAGLVVGACVEAARKLYEDEDPLIMRSGGPNKSGVAVLAFGKLPRGKGKTPPQFASPPEVTRAEVERVYGALERPLAEMEERAKYLYDLKGRLPHPALGPFSAPQWIRFAHIHTEHHVDIAREIGEHFAQRSRRAGDKA